jgi:hexosaminidase
MHLRPRLAAALLTMLSLSPTAAPAEPASGLMPQPAGIQRTDGRLPVTAAFSVALQGADDSRLRSALTRALRRWEERTGLTFAHTPTAEYALVSAERATLVITCAAASKTLPALGEDESYQLTVDGQKATLRSATTLGTLRGLETLLQLLDGDANGWFLPAVTINDQPRFPWRGLMIDVCRHWQPLDVIKRNLDGMALVKLNVLHLHLSEDQGFRVESKTHPELTRHGSDGKYFTQEQIGEIVGYAAERGIRVVPEFDIPGHATSWCVSHPELASAPGPYTIERRWGVFDPVLDPTNEATYALLADVLGEMAALFPDPYFHIGGDENNGVQWNANPRIQAFIREHQLKDNAGLHAYFNQRVRDLLARHGKRIVGWDEILHPDLPKDSVIHSWRGAEGLAAAARGGFSTILSNGYYIDLCFPAAQHYRNDPLPASSPLTAGEQQRILGGEATMWAEWVTPETIDSRIWPRTAAIAERLWSPRTVNDVPDMYRRLAIVSQRLEEAGMNHERNRPAMIRRLAGADSEETEREALTRFIDAVEPVKEYRRGGQQPDATQQSPLTGLADCARPESDVAREFAGTVDLWLAQRTAPAAPGQTAHRAEPVEAEVTAAQLHDWESVGRDTAEFLQTRAPAGRDGAPVAAALAEASAVGLEATESLRRGELHDAAWRATKLAVLDRCAEPHAAIELPMIAAVRKLVEAASPAAPTGPSSQAAALPPAGSRER